MTLNLSAPATETQLIPRIVVVGVGGAGCNAVNNMIAANLEGVEFVVANTDAQSLALSASERRVQLGINITNGLGAGARPDIGRAAAEESLDVIIDHLQGSHMAFIAAGMGGGTGTGAAPVIARAAREQGILTVGVVTKPFQFEGNNRMKSADEGIEELQHFVDTLIVIPNQNLFRVCNEHTTFADAFCMADNVLHSGVRGVTDLMVMPGLINLDFADIRTIMSEMGKAMMGTGESSGEGRSIAAAEAAIANPLLDDVSMRGARGVLINITGGYDMTLFEVDEAANRIREEVDADANIIFGSTFDEKMDGLMRVSIVSTGIDVDAAAMPRSPMISLVHDADRSQKPQPSGSSAEPQAVAGQTPPVATTTDVPPLPASTAAGDPPTMTAAAAPKSAPMTSAATAQAMAEPAPEPGQPAMTAAQPFIPPRPAMPAAREPQLRAPQPAPNASEAAMPDSAAQTEKRRGRSLFQKVTGAVNSLVTEDEQAARISAPTGESAPVQAAAASTPTPDPDPVQAPVPAPTLSAPIPETAARPAPAAAPPAPPVTKPQSMAEPVVENSAEAAVETPTEPAVEAVTKTAVETPPPAPAQPSLTNLEPTPTEAASSDDDMLEIPAFLRRQAN